MNVGQKQYELNSSYSRVIIKEKLYNAIYNETRENESSEKV